MSTIVSYNIDFVHNFCESRLQDFEPPELFNAYSSLVISAVPFYYGIPNNDIFRCVSLLFMLTGLTSFLYHYNLNHLGKQADEIPMILSTYFGTYNIIKVNCQNNNQLFNYYNAMNTLYMVGFIIFNSDYRNDYYFPNLFLIYIIATVIFLEQNYQLYNIHYRKHLFISIIGTAFWQISEVYCNQYTTYGHCIWHILFPIGFYKIVLTYDKYLINNSNKFIFHNEYILDP
jgi:hypothetical protein